MKNNIDIGQRMYNFASSIFPICRSITGQGVRETLYEIKKYIGSNVEFQVHDVPTGTKVFDWEVPKEWTIRQAYIENENGDKIIDMKNCNLHVMGYSVPIDKWVDLDELKRYIYTQPEQPEVIPYVTSYYKERFGFCMSEKQKRMLPKGRRTVVCPSFSA